MKPSLSENQEPQLQLFKTPLRQFLNLKHPLVVLGDGIDWDYFNEKFGQSFSEKGRPALPTRLMVGLTYLKHTYDLSDEVLIEQLLENGYWQYFCGYEYFQHEFICDSSSLTRWRNRLGKEGCEKLLQETLRLAHAAKLIKPKQMQEVIVDTTVQEKNIAHPTDAKLLNKAREQLVAAAQERKIQLRQSYQRVGKLLLFKQAKYAHAKQFRRARKVIKKLKTLLGRVFEISIGSAQSQMRDFKSCYYSLSGCIGRRRQTPINSTACMNHLWIVSLRARLISPMSLAVRPL